MQSIPIPDLNQGISGLYDLVQWGLGQVWTDTYTVMAIGLLIALLLFALDFVLGFIADIGMAPAGSLTGLFDSEALLNKSGAYRFYKWRKGVNAKALDSSDDNNGEEGWIKRHDGY